MQGMLMPAQNNPQSSSNYTNTSKREEDKNDVKMEDANEVNNIS